MAETYEAFERANLLASDFDNTIAMTAEPPPGGLTVEAAYEKSLDRILGREALDRYITIGGLRNRAPIEVIAELAPDLDEPRVRQKTEDLIVEKLNLLMPQFGVRLPDGSIWPRTTEGFKEAWSALSESETVDTAIISSGHDVAINRFFDVHELPEPDIIVSDDRMRPLVGLVPRQLCVKPARLLLDLAHYSWLERYGLTDLSEIDPETFLQSYERVTYVGDDLQRDGQLALNAGVDFVHVPKTNSAPAWRLIGQKLVPVAFSEVVDV